MSFRIWTVVGLSFALGVAVWAQQDAPASKEAAAELKSVKERASYSIGVNIGQNIKRDGADLDPDLIARGIRHAMEGRMLQLDEAAMEKAMDEFQQAMVLARTEKAKAEGEKNLTDGKAYMEANAKKEGVVTLPEGIQIKVIKAGDGPMPKATDTVVCHYRGTLLDGTEFDSSVKRGRPATFPLHGVIKGWTIGLQKVKVGSKCELVIPADLAYGAEGGGPIGPNATLIFEIELIAIEPPQP